MNTQEITSIFEKRWTFEEAEHVQRAIVQREIRRLSASRGDQ